MRSRNADFACAVVVVGLLAGCAGLATTFLLRSIEHLTYNYTFGSLLEGVAATGSLAGAAARLRVPYRTAWTRLREIEAGLGFKVLDTQTGGPDGGGSTLTPAAREVLERFNRVAGGVDALVDARFRVEFESER